MMMHTLRAAALIQQEREVYVGGDDMTVGVEMETAVQKPVSQPKKTRTPRTGPAPVTKGVLKDNPTFKGLMVNGTKNQQLVKRSLEMYLSAFPDADDAERAKVLVKRIEVRQ